MMIQWAEFIQAFDKEVCNETSRWVNEYEGG